MFLRKMTKPRRNRLVGTVRAGKSYQLSFKLKPMGTQPSWAAVLHFMTKVRGTGRIGRIPVVFFYPRSTRLAIRSGRRGHVNDGCDPKQHLPRNRITKVVVRVAHGRMEVFYNGRLVCRNHNYRHPTVPKKRLKLYVGDLWHHVPKARVGRVVYKRLR